MKNPTTSLVLETVCRELVLAAEIFLVRSLWKTVLPVKTIGDKAFSRSSVVSQ